MIIPARMDATAEQAEKIAEQFNQWRKDNGNLPNNGEIFSKFALQACLEYYEAQTLTEKISKAKP